MAKPLVAAVAKIFGAIFKPIVTFETNEFATPVAETGLAVYGLIGAGKTALGAAESTLADVANFHLRGRNDASTFAPPEVQVGFVLDANDRGHALFALFEVKNVVSVGREAILESL